MKIRVDAMPVRLAEDQHEFSVQLANPGHVRAVAWTLEKRLVMAAGQAQFDEVLSMFIEYSPGATMRTRRFLVMSSGQQFGVPDGFTLTHVGSAISSNTGQVAHVYEVRKAS